MSRCKIEIQTTMDIGDYSIVRANKNYIRMDSILIRFSDGPPVYFLDKYSFAFKQDESIKEFNFIIKNSKTNVYDTISNIAYSLNPYSFECNECIFIRDMMHCNDIVNKEIVFRGETTNDFKVTLN